MFHVKHAGRHDATTTLAHQSDVRPAPASTRRQGEGQIQRAARDARAPDASACTAHSFGAQLSVETHEPLSAGRPRQDPTHLQGHLADVSRETWSVREMRSASHVPLPPTPFPRGAPPDRRDVERMHYRCADAASALADKSAVVLITAHSALASQALSCSLRIRIAAEDHRWQKWRQHRESLRARAPHGRGHRDWGRSGNAP